MNPSFSAGARQTASLRCFDRQTDSYDVGRVRRGNHSALTMPDRVRDWAAPGAYLPSTRSQYPMKAMFSKWPIFGSQAHKQHGPRVFSGGGGCLIRVLYRWGALISMVG